MQGHADTSEVDESMNTPTHHEWPAVPGLIYWDAHRVADCLRGSHEHVLMDVREEGVFAEGHLFYAASVPLSRMELKLPRCVPRRDTCIVLLADDFSVIARAVLVLNQGGYSQLYALRGGQDAWRQAGYRLFSGIYVPSKAFGEVVEHHALTPRMKVSEAKQLLAGSEHHLFIDCRPEAEFQDFTFKGALNCPGADLLLRLPAQAQACTVVVNCAGRTRSIIGAQSLINAGLSNQIYALENGTMAWHLEGGQLQPGESPVMPLPPRHEIELASLRACELAQSLHIPWIDSVQLWVMTAQTDRTTYCFDVRLPSDHAHSHLPGFVSAPGGQLVQSTDHYAPVRRARMVLFDTDQVQAPMTAHWLVQMGWEVYLLKTPQPPYRSPDPWPPWPVVPAASRALTALTYLELKKQHPVMLIDCDDSRAYRREHLREAHWMTRSRIPDMRSTFDTATWYVFTSADGHLAAWAAGDAQALGLRAAYLEEGSRVAAVQIGTETERRLLCSTDDAWYSPYQLDSGVSEAMRRYIEWEIDLLIQLDEEPGVHFQVYRRGQAWPASTT